MTHIHQLTVLGDECVTGNASCNTFSLVDADLILYQQFFCPEVSDRYFTQLLSQTRWRQDFFQTYDRRTPLPRLTAWHGDAAKTYTYSGIEMQPEAWTETLLTVKSQVEAVTKTRFNSVLLNLYRHGRDGVAWHSDDEPELGQNPVIASVSFGATRRFSLRHKYRKDLKLLHLQLESGSLLLMQGKTQHHWLHQIPKTTQPVEQRINLTFRRVDSQQ